MALGCIGLWDSSVGFKVSCEGIAVYIPNLLLVATVHDQPGFGCFRT